MLISQATHEPCVRPSTYFVDEISKGECDRLLYSLLSGRKRTAFLIGTSKFF
jgi:hypothetical protein